MGAAALDVLQRAEGNNASKGQAARRVIVVSMGLAGGWPRSEKNVDLGGGIAFPTERSARDNRAESLMA